MAKGKQTCKILKEIRKQIAAENDIKLVIEECTYQGDCLGTCPKCEAEVRYLERELEKRQRMGKAAVFAGMTIGTLCAATSCERRIPRPLEGDVPYYPDSTEMQNDSISNDTIPEDTFLLESDVLATTDGYVVSWTDVPEELEVYQIVDEMPGFPEGEEKLMEFLTKNIEYPKEAREAGIQGRVFVGFVIEKDGSIGDVKVLRGIGHGCDEEAVRVVKSMPNWKPGKLYGEVVRVSYQIPVNFKLG
ncbi:MAG: energy transducer TonB [Bacteroidales bacterium]|nr:energy transducer TonB [Bacteroidales bacterium]